MHPVLGKTYKLNIVSTETGEVNARTQKEVHEILDKKKRFVSSGKRDAQGLTKEDRLAAREANRCNKAIATQTARDQAKMKAFANKHMKEVTSNLMKFGTAVTALKKMKAPKQIQSEAQKLLKDLKGLSTVLTNGTFGIGEIDQDHTVRVLKKSKAMGERIMAASLMMGTPGGKKAGKKKK